VEAGFAVKYTELLFVLALLVACTPWGPSDGAKPAFVAAPVPLGFVVSYLSEEWWDELEAKEERRIRREWLRSAGKRVCEEGEWPQWWAEDCNRCECNEGDVRSCTMRLCRHRGTGRRKR
jgi:hypothetical protein